MPRYNVTYSVTIVYECEAVGLEAETEEQAMALVRQSIEDYGAQEEERIVLQGEIIDSEVDQPQAPRYCRHCRKPLGKKRSFSAFCSVICDMDFAAAQQAVPEVAR